MQFLAIKGKPARCNKESRCLYWSFCRGSIKKL